MDFKVGNRVICTIHAPDDNTNLEPGFTGTIRTIRNGSRLPIGVEWDSDITGHDLDGCCDYGHGWWVNKHHIRHYHEDEFDCATEDELMHFLRDEI